MSISKRLRFEVFKRDNFTCQYCGAKPPDTVLEVDHVHPRCEGGADSMENLKTACWNCNRGKAHVPLVPRDRSFRLDLGPWDGRIYTFATRAKSPLLWIATDDSGTIVGYEDEWLETDDEDDTEPGSQRVRHGHPGFSNPSRPCTDKEWFTESFTARRNPHVIGAYWSRALCENPGAAVEALGWRTPDDLLVELTG